MESQASEKVLKFVFIGSSKTGKTTLIQNSAEKPSFFGFIASVTSSFKTKNIHLGNTNYKLQLWNSSGKENAMPSLNLYLKGADCVFILYNPSDRASFERLSDWVNVVRSESNGNTKVVIVENEFTGIDRHVSKREAHDNASALGLPLINVNAATGTNVEILYTNSIKYIEGNAVEWEYIWKNAYSIRAIIIGNPNAGKTTLLSKYANFNNPPVGLDFHKTTIEAEDSKIVMITWDTAGQEKFGGLSPSFYRGTHCIMILYDSSNRETFLNLEHWITEAENRVSDCLKCLVEYVKSDLPREVESFEGEDLANRHNFPFFKVNPNANEGMTELFETSAIKTVEKMFSGKKQ
ncbi:hypothetical protein SteCoe_23475 [Stentor coeruleus]|uniref:Uncharacterized protein n=1 Tax=Stentor coeruleus TaxID=5963 RepID=A0A1R2BJT2_9CILI|nr:hypothetical protein SteCoe_23475 [Stentor coeruleus]